MAKASRAKRCKNAQIAPYFVCRQNLARSDFDKNRGLSCQNVVLKREIRRYALTALKIKFARKMTLARKRGAFA